MEKYKKKNQAKLINLKYIPLRGLISFNYLMDETLYLIFKIVLETSLKNIKQ